MILTELERLKELSKNDKTEYREDAIELYKHLLRTTKGGTLYHLDNIFKDEKLKNDLLYEVCNEN